MTVQTVTPDELERIAFESGKQITLGRHTAAVTVRGQMFVARIEAAS